MHESGPAPGAPILERPVMRMRWHHLLFMHWPIDPQALRPLVPEPFEVDLFDGAAWVGLIPFTMTDVSPIRLPRIAIPAVTDFHECNVRTYVRRGDDRGVYFFSLDAASRLATWGARRFFNLPYYTARISLNRQHDTITYSVDRRGDPTARMRCRWSVGEELPTSQPGDLAHFLTERYQLMTVDRQSRPMRCRIDHIRWPLRRATLHELEESLLDSAGIDRPVAEPVLHHSDLLHTRAGRLEPMA